MDEDLGAYMNAIAGLKDLSLFHNGEHWTCHAELESGLSEIAEGDTPGAAVFVALWLLEEQAKYLPATQKHQA